MEKFLARQPIFNSKRVIYGYELLYRSSLENYFGGVDLDQASVSTADNVFLFGLEELVQGRRAFLNCTHEFLIRNYAALLPKDAVVIEVLENIKLDEELLTACQRLKHSGYLLALDDFQETPDWEPFIALADFIKVDILATSEEEQRRLAREFSSTPVRLLAEKVETHEDFQRTLDWGYDLFQGYFFSRPRILAHHDIPAYKLNYLRVLQAVNRPQVNLREVAERIKGEASLSYRLLRYLNSPAFFLTAEVRSIPHALSLLGERGMRKWISLTAVACMGDEKPQELVMLPLIRARFCELLAPAAGLATSANDLFLLGLLSAIDAILDMKMSDVLKEVTVRTEIRDALLGTQNAFRQVFEIVLLYEKGQWDEVYGAAEQAHIDANELPELFLHAVDWAHGLLSGHQEDSTEAT